LLTYAVVGFIAPKELASNFMVKEFGSCYCISDGRTYQGDDRGFGELGASLVALRPGGDEAR
jgi:hypothetical protein